MLVAGGMDADVNGRRRKASTKETVSRGQQSSGGGVREGTDRTRSEVQGTVNTLVL